MDNENDNSIYYQSVQKNVSLTVAYLIGTKMELLVNYNPGYTELFEKLEKDRSALTIRTLCNVRTNHMLNFSNTERSIVFDLVNLDRQEIYKEDIKTLQRLDISIVKANYRVTRYIADLNILIAQRISEVKDLFPEWVKWDYIKNLFVIPKGNSDDVIKVETNKFSHNRNSYPFTRYIHWNPQELGNILLNDERFLKILYKQNRYI